MKKMMSIAAVALFVVAISGCCCIKGKHCGSGCAKPCCAQPDK